MWSAHEPYVPRLHHATVHRQREDDLHDLHFLDCWSFNELEAPRTKETTAK